MCLQCLNIIAFSQEVFIFMMTQSYLNFFCTLEADTYRSCNSSHKLCVTVCLTFYSNFPKRAVLCSHALCPWRQHPVFCLCFSPTSAAQGLKLSLVRPQQRIQVSKAETDWSRLGISCITSEILSNYFLRALKFHSFLILGSFKRFQKHTCMLNTCSLKY